MNRNGVVLYFELSETKERQNSLERILMDNFKKSWSDQGFEEVILAGRGVEKIRESFRETAEKKFRRKNFTVLAIVFPYPESGSFLAQGIDSHGPATIVFGKRPEKLSLFKELVRIINEYGIPAVRIAYYITGIAKNLGELGWLMSTYPHLLSKHTGGVEG
jgi:hypothetical protein